eukprot:1162103-Pelagomonas_calceolata.AAC.2
MKRRHIGSKSRESPSPEGKSESSEGLGMGSTDSSTHTQEDWVDSNICTLEWFAQGPVTLSTPFTNLNVWDLTTNVPACTTCPSSNSKVKALSQKLYLLFPKQRGNNISMYFMSRQ